LTEVFGQGSYTNDTNVKLNSDIDINVRFTGGFYFDLPENKSEEDLGLDKLPPSGYSFKEFKDDVENALVSKFGRSEVSRENKCLRIKGNSYRVQTDVVPTWNYRRYSKNGTYVLGAKFFPDNNFWGITNFSKQHIQNAITKNTNTQKRFKRLTRLHRKIRYKMIDDGISVSNNITSFLLECLVWNTPDSIMNNYLTWTDRLKQSIIHIYNDTKEDTEACREWGEVSELLYLFYSGRKWSKKDVNEYMVLLWNYLEFK